MLYYVMIKDKVVFKGNFYECNDYINSLHMGKNLLEIRSRKDKR